MSTPFPLAQSALWSQLVLILCIMTISQGKWGHSSAGTLGRPISPESLWQHLMPDPWVVSNHLLYYGFKNLIRWLGLTISLSIVRCWMNDLKSISLCKFLHLFSCENFFLVFSYSQWDAEYMNDIFLQDLNEYFLCHILQGYGFSPLGKIIRCNRTYVACLMVDISYQSDPLPIHELTR